MAAVIGAVYGPVPTIHDAFPMQLDLEPELELGAWAGHGAEAEREGPHSPPSYTLPLFRGFLFHTILAPSVRNSPAVPRSMMASAAYCTGPLCAETPRVGDWTRAAYAHAMSSSMAVVAVPPKKTKDQWSVPFRMKVYWRNWMGSAGAEGVGSGTSIRE